MVEYFMLQSTMPNKAPKRSSGIPVQTRDSIVAMRALGTSISQIARELRVSPVTVRKYVNVSRVDEITSRDDTNKRLIPKAVDAIEKALDAGDGNLGARVLENTIWRDTQGSGNMVDNRVQVLVNELLPASVSHPLPPSTPTPTLDLDATQARVMPADATKNDTQATPSDTSPTQATEAAEKP